MRKGRCRERERLGKEHVGRLHSYDMLPRVCAGERDNTEHNCEIQTLKQNYPQDGEIKTEIQACRETGRETDRETDRERQRDRQTKRQRDIHAIQTDIHRTFFPNCLHVSHQTV